MASPHAISIESLTLAIFVDDNEERAGFMRSWNAVGTWCIVLLMMTFTAERALAQTGAPDRRPLLKVGVEIVDVAQQPSGRVWVTTRTFDVYTAMPGDRSWSRWELRFDGLKAKLEVKRVSRLIFLSDSVGVLAGDILTYERGSPVSCVLRTTNGGSSWSTSIIAPDSMAVSDALRVTSDGMMFMLDLGGRFWTSPDQGLHWSQGKLPMSMQTAEIKEMDMTSSKMGAAIDRSRTISFTTNAWQTVIPARLSSRPIVRTQPNLLDRFSWSRDLMLWNDRLILIEGRDIYITMLGDLLWERWDGVASVCMSDDRQYVYYVDVQGQLWRWKNGDSSGVKIADGLLMPRAMRAAHGRVILYRPETGPIVVDGTNKITMRMYADKGEIEHPLRTQRDVDTEWGIDWIEPNSLVIDIYRRKVPSGQWQRDTFTLSGKTLFRTVGDDSLVIGEGSQATLYDGKARAFSRYTLTKPIESFFAAPLASFRIKMDRRNGQTTTSKWCDYRLKSGQFQCSELVDSTREGVRSVQFQRSYPRDSVVQLLSAMNKESNSFPSVRSLAFTEEDKLQYRNMLDTIFRYDGYFDTLDMYRPPPSTDIQITSTIKSFSDVVNELPTLSDEQLGRAIVAFRHWPSDLDVRYMVEFTNTAGDVVHVELDRSMEVHLPLLMPWKVSYRTQAWHWYGKDMGRFYIGSQPPANVPQILLQMMDPKWMLLAVAASLDADRYGRIHRWYQRPWKK